jgi:ankyrin repeat protein
MLVFVGSEEEKNWRLRNPQGYKVMKTPATTGSTEVHRAAQEGDANGLKRALEANPEFVNAKDINGWTPLLVSYYCGYA